MKFLVDAQLPEKLARWLREQHFDAVHVIDRQLDRADDNLLWEIAKEEDRIMISKDEDFFIFAMRPKDKGRLIWLRMGNCRTAHLIQFLEKRWTEVVQLLEEGQQIVELR